MTGAQGLRGEIKIYHDSGDEEALRRLSHVYLATNGCDGMRDAKGGVPYNIQEMRMHKRTPVIKLQGVDDRAAAEALTGVEVFADKEESRPKDEGEWLASELIGLEVRICGKPIGRICGVIDNPAHDILEVERSDGTMPHLLLPFIDIFVPEVKPEDGYIRIIPPNGWLE